MIAPPAAPPTCDARTGYTARPEGWGFAPRDCTQRVGLTAFRDAAGHTRHHCSRDGHRAAAVRRYGLAAARATMVDGCPACALDGGPPHEASPRCQSGHRSHCSCSVCF